MLLALLSIVAGLPGALFPERTIRTGVQLLMGSMYENTDELRPRDWYVRAVRLQSVGMVVAGALGLVQARRAGDPADGTDASAD